MILGSDSHTRYGALGTMGVGEGGPEIVKQLLSDTYDVPAPGTVLIWVTGSPRRGVGPHDAAIALCGATYKDGFVKNRILEFAGPGVAGLPMDYRIGIDVMTTETAALSSVWVTDGLTEEYFARHGRPDAYKPIAPGEGAYYDRMIHLDLDALEPMAALPFHPSEAVTLRELIAEPGDHLREAEKRALKQLGAELKLTDKLAHGKLMIDQGIIAGCAGGMFDNIAEAAAILRGGDIGCGAFGLSIYPPSTPVQLELERCGISSELLAAGAVLKPCFCGPCFGAGDVPVCNGLSIRHTTRNFPNREGSRPSDGQSAGVILMDARSIAATARMGGVLTSAMDVDYEPPRSYERHFDPAPYNKRVYFGFGRADASSPLRFGPNIVPWPEIPDCAENLLVKLCSVLEDEVTTTDELIPSGETSSYRSNPLKLADFALSRRDPAYVGLSKAAQAQERSRAAGDDPEELQAVMAALGLPADTLRETRFGSAIFARKPGDGSAREQAASCQRILGGCANICYEFATKRYRSNCVNWGIAPFTISKEQAVQWQVGDYLYVPGLKSALLKMETTIPAKLLSGESVRDVTLSLEGLGEEERDILLAGCLMNWYKQGKGTRA